MFTGIIEEVGTLRSFGAGAISIGAKLVLSDVHIGDSIAVNGICLTVTRFEKESFQAEVMPETIRCTSLEGLTAGASVNLERAVLPTTRMGGHFVSGHIDGVGKITGIAEDKNAVLLKVAASEDLLRGIVAKGSVALDGISLTVASITGSDFTVSLIPHTRKITNLAQKKIGSLINIETDIIGKYVEHILLGKGNDEHTGQSPHGLSADFLRKHGF